MAAVSHGLEHLVRVFDVRPEVVAYDLHPEYMSTKWALGLNDVETVGVQHHHAHIASCLADNGRSDRVIGLALDGTGYGTDGTIWGCEVLVCDLVDFKRTMHLRPLPMPGGAAAIREPWRMGTVYLNAAFGAAAGHIGLDFVAATQDRWGPILGMAAAGINSPSTSSAGRLFDAAAALCRLRERVTYEGQAAAELEQVADPDVEAGYACSVERGRIDGVELIAALAEDLARGRSVAEAAAAFHNGFAAALTTACELVRQQEGLETVALSGGTWQNLLLLEKVRSSLRATGFDVITHRRVPPNDGGLSLGQAVIANTRLIGMDHSNRDGMQRSEHH
jgi:hydrogenase maturation protein HypF